ncbi:MAG TPA: hypothetical protein VI384_04270 [Candidatus Dormibacteraeota bacterium]
MATPTQNRMHSPEAGLDVLCIQFAAGASGAVGAIQGGGKRNKEFRATTPLVRNSAGNYDVFLRQQWLALIASRGECFGAIATTAGTEMKVITNSVTAAIPKVTVQFYRPDTGAAADPSNGDIVSITLFLKRLSPA